MHGGGPGPSLNDEGGPEGQRSAGRESANV